MMPFYDDLGERYDMMIRWKARLEREAPFFQRLFNENRINRVLDLGCGTGHHARLFHKWGAEAIGVDPSDKLLEIASAEKASSDGLSFVQGGFDDFHKKVEGPFGAIVALGNTLPHLRKTEEMADLFARIYGLLRPGGAFVFQNRNYDRLLDNKERFQFPTTHRRGDVEQIFFRFNDFEDDFVRFNVVYFTRVAEGGWLHEVFSTELKPWRRAELDNMLRETGFIGLDYYGDYSGTPFDPATSQDLLVLVRKPQEKVKE